MAQLQDYTTQVRQLVHDIASVDFSQTELTGYINNARNRTALDLHCVRSLVTGLNIIPGQEIYPLSGVVAGAAITNGGSGYVQGSPPAVTVGAPPAGGTTATATATVNAAGAVSLVTITGYGSAYASVPAITIAPPGVGVTATANALMLLNVLDILSISVLWPGNTNRYTMAYLEFTPFQAFMRATPQYQRNPAVWSGIIESNQLFYYPIPDQSYIIEQDVITLPNPLVNLTDVDSQILFPNADAVQFYGAYLALLKLQNFEQADVMNKIYMKRIMELQISKRDRRYRNVYKAWWRRINRM